MTRPLARTVGMCISVMLVSYYNQRYWGQSLPGIISLIGPRLSSISVGMTLIQSVAIEYWLSMQES